MFLTEGKTLYKRGGISASPTTGWQMLYESEMAWHKLEMGMTRLEHSAIVREDHGLLQEGVKEFFTKAKKWFQWAGQEFLRYLDKVIDTWVNIQNRIRTYLINVEDLKKKVKGKEIKIAQVHKDVIDEAQKIAQSADKIKTWVDGLRDAADQAAKNDDGNYSTTTKLNYGGADFIKKDSDTDGSKIDLSKFGVPNDFTEENSHYKDVIMNEADLTKAINFAKDGRIKCIKTLQYVRNSFAKLINMGIRSADAEKEDVKAIKRASSQCRETINKWISMINKATNAVISAISKAKKPETQTPPAEGTKQGGFNWF